MIEALEISDSGERKAKRGQDSVACFLHLRDLVRGHPERAPPSAVLLVRTFEKAAAAKKAAREAQLARERTSTRARQEALILAAARKRLLALIRKRAKLETSSSQGGPGQHGRVRPARLPRRTVKRAGGRLLKNEAAEPDGAGSLSR
jgi:hypothetical protein